MRRVQDEARRQPSTARRPLLTLLAASLALIALIGGISHLGGGSGSAVGGGSTPAATELRALDGASTSSGTKGESTRAPETLGPVVTVNHVPAGTLRDLAQAYSAKANAMQPIAPAPSGVVELYVPSSKWQQVQARVRELAQATADGRRVEVRLHRIPG